MPIPLTRSELANAEGRWLLEIDSPGGKIRVADQQCSMSSDYGTITFRSGLNPLSLSINEDVEAVSVTFTPQEFSFVEGMGRGYVYERMTAQLSRWYDGATYERRTIVCTGVLTGVSFGSPGNPNVVTGTLVQATSEVGEKLAQLTVEQESFDEGRASAALCYTECPSFGLTVPLIIGYPGWPTGSPAVPALELSLTEDTIGDSKISRWAIADGPIAATSVRLWTSRDNATINDADAGYQITQSSPNDHTEVVFTAGTNPFSAADQINSGGHFYTGFIKGSGGGATNPYRAGELRGLSDVLRYMLYDVGKKKVDHSSFEAYADDLNAFHIDTFINDSGTDPGAWIDSHIIKGGWPVRLIEGPRGIYARRRTYRPNKSDAVAVLASSSQAGSVSVARSTGLDLISDDIFNRIKIMYAPTYAGATFSKSVELRPDFYSDSVSGATYVNMFTQITHVCEISNTLFGTRETTVELRDVWDTGTASMYAVEYAFRHAMPRYSVTYEGGSDLEGLRIGDIVLVNDDELGFVERVATVEDVLIGGSASQVRLEIRTDPLAFGVSTS